LPSFLLVHISSIFLCFSLFFLDDLLFSIKLFSLFFSCCFACSFSHPSFFDNIAFNVLAFWFDAWFIS
jgi:hypothetical protein